MIPVPLIFTEHIIRKVIKKSTGKVSQRVTVLPSENLPVSASPSCQSQQTEAHISQRQDQNMACVEPVVEDLYVQETASHPDIIKKWRRQNAIVETVCHIKFYCG